MQPDQALALKSASPALAASPECDAAARLLRHVLKVWAREQGVPEADLPGMVASVIAFAETAAHEGRFGGEA